VQVSISGLILCGLIVGALGVLNDVTVTQASAVWELSAADPDAGWRKLFASGMRIGRDHIASTIYTLVFAYAGATLPLLLLFTVSGRTTHDLLTGDEIAGAGVGKGSRAPAGLGHHRDRMEVCSSTSPTKVSTAIATTTSISRPGIDSRQRVGSSPKTRTKNR